MSLFNVHQLPGYDGFAHAVVQQEETAAAAAGAAPASLSLPSGVPAGSAPEATLLATAVSGPLAQAHVDRTSNMSQVSLRDMAGLEAQPWP